MAPCGARQVSHPSGPFGLICVRIPTHLRQSRHGIFFFRIVVPKALRSSFDGRCEIKRSLHTRNVRVALVEARQLALAAYQLFDLVKCSMAGIVDINNPSAFEPDGTGSKFEYTVEENLNTGTRITRIKTDPSSAASVEAGKRMALEIEARKHQFIGKRATDDPEALARDAEERAELAAAMGLVPESHASPSATVPPLAASADAIVPRQTKLNVAQLSPADRKRLLSNLWGEYSAQQAKSNWTKSRTVSDYNQKFEVFLEWMGDRPIHWVRKIDYSSFKNWMLTEYRAPDLKPGKPAGLNPRSVDKYTTAVNGLFKWAQASGYFPDREVLPTSLQTIMSKSAVKKRAKKREANRNFQEHELPVAFNPETYLHENQVVHHFWPPLLALFTGARRAEVSQLLIRDVRQDSNGLWLLDITDDDRGKNVKNESARRTVPLHPTLIEIGFLDYLEEVKKAGLGESLFPGIGANKHNEKGNAVGNAWRRYLIACGLRTEEQVDDDPNTLTFHSLRHTAISVLRNAGVAYDLRCQMVGHEAEGQHAEYGGPAVAATLAEKVLPVFHYPGLDFSKLRYKVGSLEIRKKRGYSHAPRSSGAGKEKKAAKKIEPS